MLVMCLTFVSSAGQIGINFDTPSIGQVNIVNVTQTDFWWTNEGVLDNVIDIFGSWITNNLNWINRTQADDWFNFTTQIDSVNLTIENSNASWLSTYNATYLGMNTTANAQALLNGTSMNFANVL